MEEERSMPADDGERVRDQQALVAAIDEALAGFPDEDRAATREAVDERWLGIGIRLAMERPDQARGLLAMIAASEAEGASRPDAAAADVASGAISSTESVEGPIPVPSSLLARAAALPASQGASIGPDMTFGWAASLTPGQILMLGRVVGDMLAAGSPPDIEWGFGLTWDAGVRLPRNEAQALFGEFRELEVTVGGVLSGRDLRATEPPPRPQGLAGLLGAWGPRTRPGESQAAAAVDASGEPARRGLLALWNVWMAMRYRKLISRPTFDLLVQPWETVVGPLPEA
jgi:hypothetical protein